MAPAEAGGSHGFTGSRPKGGRRRALSLGLWPGMRLVAVIAVALASSALAARDAQPLLTPSPSHAPIGITTRGSAVSWNPSSSDTTDDWPKIESESPGGSPTPADSAASASPAAVVSTTPQAPDPAVSSWSAPPQPVPQAPVPTPQPAAERLAQEAAQHFGIRIVLGGQDWGQDEASQATNIGAVISVMERLPPRVVSAVATHPHGPLTFVSNSHGRSLAGWQPYGDFPIGFYTNSDQNANGGGPANQVVLIPGFTDMSVGHEVLHAYQFRQVETDQYVLALLGEEMRSFMAAVGWRQTGTDEQVREAANQPWSVVNGLYRYEGRPLTYVTADGFAVTLNPANPLEAFAVAGSIYYTRPAGMPLPDWPEYWAWFQANLG